MLERSVTRRSEATRERPRQRAINLDEGSGQVIASLADVEHKDGEAAELLQAERAASVDSLLLSTTALCVELRHGQREDPALWELIETLQGARPAQVLARAHDKEAKWL